MKSCKNNAEINGSRKAHLVDGIALTKFIYWLENEVDGIKIIIQKLVWRENY